jgi:hypothetical protein
MTLGTLSADYADYAEKEKEKPAAGRRQYAGAGRGSKHLNVPAPALLPSSNLRNLRNLWILLLAIFSH